MTSPFYPVKIYICGCRSDYVGYIIQAGQWACPTHRAYIRIIEYRCEDCKKIVWLSPSEYRVNKRCPGCALARDTQRNRKAVVERSNFMQHPEDGVYLTIAEKLDKIRTPAPPTVHTPMLDAVVLMRRHGMEWEEIAAALEEKRAA